MPISLTELNDIVTDFILIIDEDGVYQDVNNEGYLRRFFPAHQPVIGQTFHDLFPISQADSFLAFTRYIIESNEVMTTEYEMKSLDGELFHFESKARRLNALIDGKRATISFIRA